MEENQTPTSPIAGEPAVLKHIGFALDLVAGRLKMFKHPENYWYADSIVDEDDMVILQHHLTNAKHSVPRAPASLKPGMVVPRGALMALRATLHRALWDFADTDGLPLEQLPWEMMAHDLAAAVSEAHAYVSSMLGITEPADD